MRGGGVWQGRMDCCGFTVGFAGSWGREDGNVRARQPADSAGVVGDLDPVPLAVKEAELHAIMDGEAGFGDVDGSVAGGEAGGGDDGDG